MTLTIASISWVLPFGLIGGGELCESMNVALVFLFVNHGKWWKVDLLTEKYVFITYWLLKLTGTGFKALISVLYSFGQLGGIDAFFLPISQYTLKIFMTSSTRHLQSVIKAPSSLTWNQHRIKVCSNVLMHPQSKEKMINNGNSYETWVSDRQSLFALPTYMCFPSAIQSFVCSTPAPNNFGKSTERTMAAFFLTSISVSILGETDDGALCAMRILMPPLVPAFKRLLNISSPCHADEWL